MLQLTDLGDHEAQLRGVSWMFPISRVAAAALLDAWATNLEIVATWVDANTGLDQLHTKAAQLRDLAAVLRRHEDQARKSELVVPQI